VTPEGVIRYRLGDAEAARRARAATIVRASASLAPVILAVVLLQRIGWQPGAVFWAVAATLVALVAVRAAVGYGDARRKLAALVVTVGDEAIHAETARDRWTVDRARVGRIVEVDGRLGGLRVESLPDPRSGEVLEIQIPRGGEGYADVRARLDVWRLVERRGRRGPAVRFAVGALVVAAIFFVPFVLEDFVARSKVLAAALVAGMWVVTRLVLRGR
jgi:hypothetical protein